MMSKISHLDLCIYFMCSVPFFLPRTANIVISVYSNPNYKLVYCFSFILACHLYHHQLISLKNIIRINFSFIITIQVLLM